MSIYIISTFSKLMSSKSVKTIRNVSKFAYFAMLRKTNTINTVASNGLYSVYVYVFVSNYLGHLPLFAGYILAKRMYIIMLINMPIN